MYKQENRAREVFFFFLDIFWRFTNLFRKPWYIPLANALGIPNDYFEGVEVEGSNCIESDIEED